MTSNMQPGHQGKLMVGGVECTGVRGATVNRNLRNAEGGGWGDSHDYKIAVQPGTPQIEATDPIWNPSVPQVEDLITSMQSGGSAVCHLYPFGNKATPDITYYWTGTFILEDPSIELSSEDGIKYPFTLVSCKPDFRWVDPVA